MLIGLLFWILTLLCCSHAIAFGGRDGRWAAFLILAASVLSLPPTLMDQAYAQTELLLLAVDLLLLAGLYSLMLASGRYWPIWMTGFHVVAVVTHLSTLLAPDFTPHIYRAVVSFWAIPMPLVLVIGVERDRRAAGRTRLATAGPSERARYES